MRHYFGSIFLPQVANAIGGDDPHAGLQIGQGTTTFVSGRLTVAMVGTGPQPAKHSLPLALLPLSLLRTLSGGGAQFVLLQGVCAGPRAVESLLEGCR